MNVVVEQLPNCLATLKVEVEPEKVSSARNELVDEFGKAAKIPGFRPGKAPRAAIEKRFKKEIREELQKKLVQDGAREAIKSKGLRVLQVASVDDVEIPELDGSGASFTATVVTHPEFELPNYKGMVVRMRPTEVTDEEIEKSLEQLRDQAADFVDLKEERGAQMEDYVVVDYRGSIDGQPVHELFPKAGKPLTANEDFWIKMTEEAFFPGFCGALLGAKPDETREFDVTVPADFPVEGMPGQVIHYNVTVKAIKEKALPALDDAFADTVAKGKTLTELREMAREEITRQKRTDAEAGKRADIMKELLSKIECELPTSMVRAHTQSIINDIVRENTARGVGEEILKENEKDIVASAAANARERLKGTFVLMRIAEQEGLRVTQEELLGRVASMAQRYKLSFEKMMKELQGRGAIDQIHEEMLTAKTLDFLVSNASVTTAPVAPTTAA